MTFISNNHKLKIILTLATFTLLAYQSEASSQQKLPESKPGVPISFSADKVTTNLNQKIVVLTGKAIIFQEDKQINADQIEIDYSETKIETKPETKKDDSKKAPNETQQIKKVTATGNVKISMGDRLAITEKAVFTAADKKIILTGKDSTVTAPEGKLTCDKIVIDQNTSISECIGSGKSRASGLIFSDKNGF